MSTLKREAIILLLLGILAAVGMTYVVKYSKTTHERPVKPPVVLPAPSTY